MPSGRTCWIVTPEIEEAVKRFLSQGMPLKQVADLVDVRYPTLLHYAKKNCLPYNRPIRPGSIKEAKVCRCVVAGFPLTEIARFFRVAPCVIQETIERVKSIALDPREN